MESEGLWKSITWMSNTSTAEPGIFPKGETQGINEQAHQATAHLPPQYWQVQGTQGPRHEIEGALEKKKLKGMSDVI